jgi:hypothetical protein
MGLGQPRRILFFWIIAAGAIVSSRNTNREIPIYNSTHSDVLASRGAAAGLFVVFR